MKSPKLILLTEVIVMPNGSEVKDFVLDLLNETVRVGDKDSTFTARPITVILHVFCLSMK